MGNKVILEIPNFPRKGQTAKIVLSSIQWGPGRGISTPTGTSAKRESSQPNITDLVITKPLDEFSTFLFTEALQGVERPMNIYFMEVNGNTIKTYLSIYLENAMISNYSVSSGGDRPSESITVNFTKVTYKYPPPSEKGVEWDLAN